VNFVGAGKPDEHSFHNTDRLMRSEGFDLSDSTSAIARRAPCPHRYVWPTPAEPCPAGPSRARPTTHATCWRRMGRRRGRAERGEDRQARRHLSAWDVPDAAAELLVGRREILATLFDVDAGLDLLAAQTQKSRRHPLSYRGYMATFEADAPAFYRPEGPVPMMERIKSAWRGYWHRARSGISSSLGARHSSCAILSYGARTSRSASR